MKGQVVKQKVEMRSELLEAPIIKTGPKKGQPGSTALVESAPIVLDGPNRGKILPKSFKSLPPGNEYGLPAGTYPYDKVTGDILSDAPVHAYRSNDSVTAAGHQPDRDGTKRVWIENPLGILQKRLEALEAELAASKVAKVEAKPKV